MKKYLFLLIALIVFLSFTSALAVTQDEYDAVVRQRDALYQQLIDAGIEPCIQLAGTTQETAALVAEYETPASEFVYGSNGSEIRINGFIGDSTEIVIPQAIDGVPVTMIGEKAFSETKITSVLIPEGVTKIGKNAFYRCKSLRAVSLPSTLTYLSVECFSVCDKLSTVIGLDHILQFGENCFEYCRSLTGELVFDRDVELYWGAFSRTGITGVKFLSGKCNVKYCAFSDSPIKYCYIDEACDFSFEPYSTNSIYGTFYDCENLTTLVVPASVTWFPDYLLNGCKLVTVYAPAGSEAEKFANSQFISVNTAAYEQKVAEFKSK